MSADPCFTLRIINATEDSKIDPRDYHDQLQEYVTDLLTSDDEFGDNAFTPGETPVDVYLGLIDPEHLAICLHLTSRAKNNIEKFRAIITRLREMGELAPELIDPEGDTISPFILQLPEQTKVCAIERVIKKRGEKAWDTLEHSGPYFGWINDPYVPYNAPLIYNDKQYHLNPEEEEAAILYARRLITEEKSAKKFTTGTNAEKFNNNFWNDFRASYLTPEHKKIFIRFEKANFSLLIEAIKKRKLQQDELKKNETKEEKKIRRIKAAEHRLNYGVAYVNGIKTPLIKYAVEPMALFVGAGANMTNKGKIKSKVYPEDVTINISKGSLIPPAPNGYKWGKIVHDNTVRWTSKYRNQITTKLAETRLQETGDLIKFEKARKLEINHDAVVEAYTRLLNSNNIKEQQIGVVISLLDTAGIRVGTEKVASNEDVVGATTLKVGQIEFGEDNKTIQFNFIGKDGIQNTSTTEVNNTVFRLLQKFSSGKQEGTDDIFNLVTAQDINNYLHSIDRDLSSRIFRTRLACHIMYNYLNDKCQYEVDDDESKADKISCFRQANRLVAIQLNHIKTATPSSLESFSKAQEKLEEKRSKMTAEKITQAERKLQERQENLTIALETSKRNYIDPRIIKAWALKSGLATFDEDEEENPFNIPPAIYTKTLQRHFKWCIDDSNIDEHWDYMDAEFECISGILNGVTSQDDIQEEIEHKKPVSKRKSRSSVLTAQRSAMKKPSVSQPSVSQPSVGQPIVRRFGNIQTSRIMPSNVQVNIPRTLVPKNITITLITLDIFKGTGIRCYMFNVSDVDQIKSKLNLNISSDALKYIPFFLANNNILLINSIILPRINNIITSKQTIVI